MNFAQFGRRMQQIGVNVETNAAKAVKLTALAVDQTVVLATPVDTGRARANWQVQAGAAPAGVRDAYVPGTGATTGAQNAQAAIEQGKIAISAATPGLAIHITNNLPYIGKLNEGHSAQAPAGFVEQAVQNGVATVRRTRLIE
jgi:hypothetical protein